MNKERLLKLADFLEALPAGKFDYRKWVGSSWDGEQLPEPVKCNTTACAFGWATAIPEFKALGLVITKRKVSDVPHVALATDEDEECEEFTRTERAGKEIFDLEPEEVMYLFVPGDYTHDEGDNYDMDNPLAEAGYPDRPDEYASAKEVAAHIRQFVERS